MKINYNILIMKINSSTAGTIKCHITSMKYSFLMELNNQHDIIKLMCCFICLSKWFANARGSPNSDCLPRASYSRFFDIS